MARRTPSTSKAAALAVRDYRDLHDGLAPPTMREETVRTGDRIVARLGRAPEFRYWKLVFKPARLGRPEGPGEDLYRHHNMEHYRRAAGLIRSLRVESKELPYVLARLPVWGVTEGGQLAVLNQDHIFVTDRGIEDRPNGEPGRVLGRDGRPGAPQYLVSLGPLPEIRWLTPEGRVMRHVFFAELQRTAPAVASFLLPQLAHDGRGNLFVVRQGHIRVHPDGTIEESMSTTKRVPHANPSKSKEIVRHSSSTHSNAPARRQTQTTSTTRVTATPVPAAGETPADIGKAMFTAAVVVVGSALALRRTSLSTVERAGGTAVALGLGGLLVRNKAPNVAMGLAIGGAAAAAMPLFDSASVAFNSAPGAANANAATTPPAGTNTPR